MHYSTIPDFEHVYLEDSFVIGWRIGPDSVEFELDLVLTESHDLFRPPGTDQLYCYRRARLRFPCVRRLAWVQIASARTVEADAEMDYGNIDFLDQVGDQYVAEGDWGKLEVVSGRPELEISSEQGAR